MAAGIVPHSIHPYKITLVLHGTGTGQNLPSRLTRCRPVGNEQNAVILTPRPVTAPAGEAQIITGEQQPSHPAITDDGTLRPGCVVPVLAAMGEEVALVVKRHTILTTIDKVEAITISSVGQSDSQTATDGTTALTCRLPHPPQGSIVSLITDHAGRFCDKPRAPHFGKHIEIRVP